uniref:hypothetical protein n=1 Tax=Candidatus Electrothrix sp. TaxID=2170559 RepID=UPI0040578226
MYIDKIELFNFRNLIGNHNFSFKKGINLFYGGNFAGKSSIHKAIALSLNINDGDNKNIVEYINDTQESSSVTLWFDHSGHTYKHHISFNRKNKTTARELYIDGEENPSYNTASTVKEHLAKIIDPTLGEHALFMMQDQLSIINAKDAERLDLFKKIRNINFKKQADELEAQIKIIKETTLRDVEINIVSLNNKEYHKTEMNEDILSKEEVDTLEKELLSLDADISKAEVTNLVFNQTKEKISSIKISIDDVDTEVKESESLIEKKNGLIEALESKHKEYISAIELTIKKSEEELSASLDLSGLEAERKESINLIDKEISTTQEAIGSIEVKRVRWRDFEEEISPLLDQQNDLKVDRDILQNTLNACKEGMCPTCHKPFESIEIVSHEKELSDVKESIIKIEEEINSLKLLNKEQEEEKETQRKNLEKRKELSNKLAQLEEKKEYTQKRFDERISEAKSSFESKKDSLKHLIEEKKSNLESKKADHIDAIGMYKDAISVLEAGIKKSKEKKESLLKDLNKVEEELSSLNTMDVDDKIKAKYQIEERLSTQKEIEQYNKLAEEANIRLRKEKESDKKKLNALVQERDDLNADIEYKASARKILLKDFPNFIIQQTIKDIEDKMNNFVEQVREKGMNLTLKGTATSLKFLCGNDSERLRDVSSTSGAERFLIALGFVNIFNQELELNCILLDEVDQAMNEENTQKLFDIISSLPFEQIFIITHNKVLQNSLIEGGANTFEFTEGKVLN